MSENLGLVTATVFLKSESGNSLAAYKGLITFKNLKRFRPSKKVVTKAITQLENLGFNVFEKDAPLENVITLTITGEPQLFERVFNVRLSIKKHPPSFDSPGGTIVRTDRELTIPSSMKELIEKISFGEPIEFFS